MALVPLQISISGICHFHEVGICHYLVNGGDKNYFCGRSAEPFVGKELS